MGGTETGIPNMALTCSQKCAYWLATAHHEASKAVFLAEEALSKIAQTPQEALDHPTRYTPG